MDQVHEYTALLRNGDAFWARLRVLLLAQGIDSSTCALATSSEEGKGLEFGVVVTRERRVFEYMVDYKDGVETAALADWMEFTTWYPASPYRREVEEAMAFLDDE